MKLYKLIKKVDALTERSEKHITSTSLANKKMQSKERQNLFASQGWQRFKEVAVLPNTGERRGVGHSHGLLAETYIGITSWKQFITFIQNISINQIMNFSPDTLT